MHGVETISNLVITLFQSLLRKSIPAIRTVDGLCSFRRYIEISALDRQLVSCVRILDEV